MTWTLRILNPLTGAGIGGYPQRRCGSSAVTSHRSVFARDGATREAFRGKAKAVLPLR